MTIPDTEAISYLMSGCGWVIVMHSIWYMMAACEVINRDDKHARPLMVPDDAYCLHCNSQVKLYYDC